MRRSRLCPQCSSLSMCHSPMSRRTRQRRSSVATSSSSHSTLMMTRHLRFAIAIPSCLTHHYSPTLFLFRASLLATDFFSIHPWRACSSACSRWDLISGHRKKVKRPCVALYLCRRSPLHLHLLSYVHIFTSPHMSNMSRCADPVRPHGVHHWSSSQMRDDL